MHIRKSAVVFLFRGRAKPYCLVDGAWRLLFRGKNKKNRLPRYEEAHFYSL